MNFDVFPNIGYVCTYLQILFSNKVLFFVRSLFVQVSRTWVTDCTLWHTLHKGSFVLVFLKLLNWLSIVYLAFNCILVNIDLTLAEHTWLGYGFASYRSF